MPSDPGGDGHARSRRRVLQSVGVAAFVALAGCASDGDGESATTTAPTATESATATTTADAPPTTTAPRIQRETALGLVDALATGDYDAAFGMLSERLQDQYSTARLEADWEQTTGDYGRFESVAGVERTTMQGYDVVVVRAQFEAGVVVVQVAFDRESVEGLQFRAPQSAYSPPGYAVESAFEEREVALDSPACDLGATLTKPTDGADTGVVLVHGSGPHDRDETIGPNKPFRDLAWGLATEGVAVLRYDKRTFACEVATDEVGFDGLVVEDALTALTALREKTSVDAAGVVGHSLGGYAAPRIAERDGDVDAFLLAAPARPLYELVVDQLQYLATLDNSVTDVERARIENAQATAERLSSGEFADGGFEWGASFWRDVAEYDAVATAQALPSDVYALQGGRDYQVSPDQDFPAWVDALGDDRTRLYESLNHLFVPGEGEPTPSEYVKPGNVAGSVVSDLVAWLTA